MLTASHRKITWTFHTLPVIASAIDCGISSVMSRYCNDDNPNETRTLYVKFEQSFEWRHNGCDSVSNHQPSDCLHNRLSSRIPKKTSKLRVTGLCAGNSPGTGEFPAQRASDAEHVSIWWRHHDMLNPLESPFTSMASWHGTVFLCEGNPAVTGGFHPYKGPVIRNFWCFLCC